MQQVCRPVWQGWAKFLRLYDNWKPFLK
jgi:hypothetical protein